MTDGYSCQIDGHGEDITAQVLAAIGEEGSIVFRAKRRLLREKQRELYVYCSLGHLNIVDLEDA